MTPEHIATLPHEGFRRALGDLYRTRDRAAAVSLKAVIQHKIADIRQAKMLPAEKDAAVNRYVRKQIDVDACLTALKEMPKNGAAAKPRGANIITIETYDPEEDDTFNVQWATMLSVAEFMAKVHTSEQFESGQRPIYLGHFCQPNLDSIPAEIWDSTRPSDQELLDFTDIPADAPDLHTAFGGR